MSSALKREPKTWMLSFGQIISIDIKYSPNLLTGLPRGLKYNKNDLESGRLASIVINVDGYGSIGVSRVFSQKNFCRRYARKVTTDALLHKLRVQYSDKDKHKDNRIIFSKDDRRTIFKILCPEYRQRKPEKRIDNNSKQGTAGYGCANVCCSHF